MLLTKAVLAEIENILGEKILKNQRVSGGDINEAHQLSTAAGNYFVKLNNVPFAKDMFEKEAYGLELISKSLTIPAPSVVGIAYHDDVAFLILDWIESGSRQANFWENFGLQLANLHKVKQPDFGLVHHNYIGSLIQFNNKESEAIPFFINQRLLPQIKIAKKSNKIETNTLKDFNTLFKKLPDILPDEKPALTHGDLWNGNFMVNEKGNAVLIDPAISFSLREMDLAMSRLFGGFDEVFYQSYKAAFPVQPNLKERIPIYQLYYLMVHVNLFGGGYLNSVRSILKQFC